MWAGEGGGSIMRAAARANDFMAGKINEHLIGLVGSSEAV